MLGETFEVLTFGSRIGEFVTVNGLEVGGWTDLRVDSRFNRTDTGRRRTVNRKL